MKSDKESNPYRGSTFDSFLKEESNILKQHKIRPFVELNSIPTKKFFDKIKFKITNFKVVSNDEGWLIIILGWSSCWKDNQWRFKYPSDGGCGSGGGENYAQILFNEVKFRYKWKNVDGSSNFNTTKFSIDAGFEFETEDDMYEKDGISKRFPYEYKFSVNKKYGVLLYFSPENWDSGEKLVFDYDLEKDKERYL